MLGGFGFPCSCRLVEQSVPNSMIVFQDTLPGDASRDQAGAMFSLFYGLWKYMFHKDELRVLILGVDKAGKTTLLEKLKSIYLKGEGLPLDRVVPTIGLNIGRIEDANAKLVFWDLGGQVR
ncbi:hypothetical protein PR202_gn00350 [Eleusine coracana subsp. coracana]|uniref:Uncharacterized protein n=1 Tax=Eleusine coracana subsp. coracana TaxID=191504 RepID=A0AAV5G1Y7_ELECO|nr:hypothetical protein PR202_gn00350 [Eleusine coracana subsp. coracana]